MKWHLNSVLALIPILGIIMQRARTTIGSHFSSDITAPHPPFPGSCCRNIWISLKQRAEVWPSGIQHQVSRICIWGEKMHWVIVCLLILQDRITPPFHTLPHFSWRNLCMNRAKIKWETRVRAPNRVIMKVFHFIPKSLSMFPCKVYLLCPSTPRAQEGCIQ